MTTLILSLLTVVAIAAIFMGAFLFVRAMLDRRRAYWRRRLHGDDDEEGAVVGIGIEAKPAGDWSERVDQGFERLVQQTGRGWATGQVLGVIALVAVIFAGALLLWREDFLLASLGLIVGLVVPLFTLLLLRARWRQSLQDQLPDVFFLLARSLRAGESMEQALGTVAEHGPRPLASEFRQGVDKIRLGLSVPATLNVIGRRLRLSDFDVFVTAVTLHRTIGGNLATLLDRVATSTRDRNLFRGYFRAATALGRITGFFICAAPPVLLLGYWLIHPEFIERFMESAMGIRALTTAGVLEVVGTIWLFWLLRIDY